MSIMHKPWERLKKAMDDYLKDENENTTVKVGDRVYKENPLTGEKTWGIVTSLNATATVGYWNLKECIEVKYD